MAPPALGSGRSLRAAWERQQRTAELATAVARIPQLARSKPAFFAAQLQPVLLALQQAAEAEREAEEEGTAAQEQQALSEGPQEGQSGQTGSAAQRQLAAAASHLRRLVCVDRQAGANASLLLWLLLGLATQGEGRRAQGAHLASLCASLGWQALLLEALLLLLLSAQPAEMELLADLAGVAAAEAANSSNTHLQAAAHQVAACLAGCTQRQLEEHGSNGDSVAQQALLVLMAALQLLLLAAPAVAAAPDAAAALQQLQAAADASMAGLMQAMQAAGEQQAGWQAVFQQLCQLRARLMLAFAAAGAAADAAADGTEASEGSAAASTLHIVADSNQTTAQAWRSVLLMPPDVAAAAAAAASAAVGRGSAGHPTRQQFLAAWAAATSYLQASASIAWGSSGGSGGGASSGNACISTTHAGVQPPHQAEIPALPGVHFQPPAPPLASAPSHACTAAGFEAAAEAAAAEVAHEPDCLGPVHLTLAALRLTQRVAASGQGAAGSSTAAAATAARRLLLELAAAAAAMAGEPRQQRQLLLLLLHSQQAWLCRLREALAADAELQRSCRRELVAVANRLASEPGTGAAGAPAVVHGEERRRRTAAAVAALLPHALLCPAAVLERLVKEAVVQAGEQVGLLLDVLQEMAPLAAYRPQPAEPPLLLTMLARLLLPSEPGAASVAALDTPGSRDAFVQLVAGMCGCRPATHGKPPAPAAAAAAFGAGAAGQPPLLSPAAVLEHVVSPALQLQQQADEAADPGQLLLPLQLAQLLAGSPAAPTAGAQQQQKAAQNLALLRLQLEALLDLDGRRIDHSAAALQASPETFELAAAILQQAGASGSAAGGSAAKAAGRYFRRQLQHAGRLEPGQQPQSVAQQRQRMVQLLAVLLPCLTAAEAAEVLQAALPATIQELLLPPAARQQAGAAILPGAHAAAVEAACRAVLALALQPGLAPIAGEQATAAEADAAPSAEPRPLSALRAVAVERALQHVVQHCVNLAAAGAALAAGSPAGLQPALQLQPAEAQALGLRCTRELCQLAAALQQADYDCSTAQVGLLQLAKQLLAPPASAAAPEVAASPAASAQQAQQAQQQQPQLAPQAHVRQQLEAAAASLPEGRPRDVLLLGIQQACAD